MSGICSAHKEFMPGCKQCEARTENEIEWLDRMILSVQGIVLEMRMRREMLNTLRGEKP